jgi:hypothetical protein
LGGKVRAEAALVRDPKAEMYNELQTFVLKIVLLLAVSAFLAVVTFAQ